ncbi:ABC transporter substrate-binding protein [Paramicrobacterium fandaimingii]|uniref:ABC transporter substrate-binding protein n=1 Tax=Paramicrobacterium fandaimingii TaxID=2708079 RepID=UPI00141E98DF|nr:extracellular solute-binding protein [Microbacterium fandaimingii]
MTWKRRTVGIAAAAGLALSLAACSGGAEGAGGSGPHDGTGEVSGQIAVAWWGGEARSAKTNAVIKMFTEQSDGVKVDGQATADFSKYFDKLNVQAASQSLPCAVQLQGRQVNDYTKNDLLMPLDPMIESGAIDVSDIPETVLDNGRGTDGNLYFLPYGAAYDAVGVNTTLADDAGVGLPEEGYTWDDYISYLTEAQESLPEGVRAMDSNGGRPNFFIGWTLANGKSLFNDEGKLGFSEDDLIEYWNMWEGVRKAGVTMPAERTAEEPTGPDQGFFATGEVMSDTIPGNALTPASATLEGKGDGQQMTTIPYPRGSEGSGNALYPSGFAIPKSCENVPTAAAFIDFFTNDLEAGKAFAADNGAPTNTKVLEALIADDSLTPTKKHELELYKEIVQGEPQSIVFPPGYQATFEASFKRAYEDVSFERSSVEDAVKQFFSEANSSLGI